MTPAGAAVDYARVFDALRHSVILHDADGMIIAAKPAAERATGLTHAELLGRMPSDPRWHAVHDDGSPWPGEDHPPMVALRTGHVVESCVMGLAHQVTGELRWIRVSAVPFFREGESAPFQVMSSFTDITEQRRAELQLHESRMLLQRAEAAANLGHFELDLRSRIMRASAGAARIYGLDGSEWAMDTIREAALSAHHATLDAAMAALVAGERVYDVSYQIRRHADGEVRDVRISAEYDAARQVVFGVVTDETARLGAQAALRASEGRFERAFRDGPVMMAISELESGRYFDVNARYCDVSGFARESLIGHTSAGVGLIEREERRKIREALRTDGRITNLEVPLRTAAGREITVLMSGEVMDLNGTPCLLTIATDISDMKRMEAERALLEAQVQHLRRMESIGRLAGGVAHDMNNVLTAILTLAELQSQEAEPGSALHEDMETIAQSALRGQTTVRGLLRFARSDVSSLELLDLNTLIREEVALLARTTLQQAVLSTELDEALPLVRGDRAALTHVFMNLCLNAVDAMPDGGTITVRTRRDGPAHLVAEVVDSGTGMPAEVLEKALDPFFTTKPQGRGTGLGLSIVFGTVQAHGGTIKLRSAPGQGTTVRIRLPAVHEATAMD